MRKTTIILSILAISASVSAQTIKLGTIQTIYCDGDNATLYVPYQATGTFNADNVFKVHISDNTGSFASFTLTGSSTDAIGMLAVPPNLFTTGTRVQVASSDPYILSDTSKSMSFLVHPKPAFWAERLITGSYYGNSQINSYFHGGNGTNQTSACPGFAGDTLVFAPPPFDSSFEAPETSFQLTFPQDATVISSYDSTARVVFSKPGINTVSIAVSSPLGCTGGSSWTFDIANHHPTIPAHARVITSAMGNVAGNPSDTAVWVKAGGSYQITTYTSPCAIFAEPGSSIVWWAGGGSISLYLRPGASYTYNTTPLPQIFIFQSGGVDTFFDANLTFDYSQAPSGVTEVPTPALSLHESGDHLFANADGLTIDARVTNLLGTEALSQQGSGMLDVDLSSLPVGIYFAVVQAGDARQVQRIAVVH